MKSKLLYLLIFGVLIFALAACSSEKKSKEEGGGANAQAQARPQKIPGLSVHEVARENLPRYYRAAGTIEAVTTTALQSKATGYVNTILVKEGDGVRKGNPLIYLRAGELDEGIKSANAGLEQTRKGVLELEDNIKAIQAMKEGVQAKVRFAESTYNRYKKLLQEESVSRQEFEEMESNYRVAQSELKRVEENLKALATKRGQVSAGVEMAQSQVKTAQVMKNYTIINAPFDGVVSKVFIEVGDLATPGMKLMEFQDQSRFQLMADISEKYFSFLNKEKNAYRVIVETLGDREIPATLSKIEQAANPQTRSFKAKFLLKSGSEEGLSIRSGMYAKVLIPTESEEVVTVKKEGVFYNGQLTGVFVLDKEKTVRLRWVKLGEALGDTCEVLSGLQSGEKYLTGQIEKVFDGMRVEVES